MGCRIGHIVITALMLATSAPLYAQDDFRKIFDSFAESSRQKQETFTDSVNMSFILALQEQWEKFHLNDGLRRSEKPEPADIPVATLERTSESVPVKVSEIITSASASCADMDTVGLFGWFSGDVSKYRTVRFTFYETEMVVTVPKQYGTFHPEDISEDGVSSFWSSLASYDYNRIIDHCLHYRDSCGLNDWAVLEWTQKLAEALFPENRCYEQTIFTVFIMNQMGLMAKVARSGSSLLCLFSPIQKVYARKFVMIDDHPYYLAGEKSPASDVYTYRIAFSSTPRPFDMRLSRSLRFGNEHSRRVIVKPSSVFGISIEVSVNSALMNFYSHYPQTDVYVYAIATSDGIFENDFLMKMKSLVKDGRTPLESLNLLLKFLQYDFDYKVDMEQFGYEKPFFCEENFVYEYNDCEDRVILMSRIVRALLGMDALILEYPDHVALAVNLPDNLAGDYVNRNEHKYYICDPTFIGSRVGMSIPKYRNIPAKVWTLK